MRSLEKSDGTGGGGKDDTKDDTKDEEPIDADTLIPELELTSSTDNAQLQQITAENDKLKTELDVQETIGISD